MKRSFTILMAVLVMLYIAARLTSGAVEAWLDEPYDGAGGRTIQLVVPRGATAAEVARDLAAAGIIRDPRILQYWLRATGRAGQIHAGSYEFSGGQSVREVAEALLRGRVLLRPITIPEGVTRWQVAEAVEAAGFGVYEEALRATGRAELIADLDPDATDLEGYLFPDTYMAAESATPDAVVEMMVDRFRKAWTASRQALAESRGMSLREVVTLASLVETEAAMAHERPLVAAVYQNRLQRGMLLQCDPTLLYALMLDGRTDRNIRRADFENDSPYNTYRFRGLPPGPIANPGDASLEAALRPAAVDFLYFVARNDGSHAFSKTLREHNAMVNRYQRGGRRRGR
jgi:UPF0755 protein